MVGEISFLWNDSLSDAVAPVHCSAAPNPQHREPLPPGGSEDAKGEALVPWAMTVLPKAPANTTFTTSKGDAYKRCLVPIHRVNSHCS